MLLYFETAWLKPRPFKTKSKPAKQKSKLVAEQFAEKLEFRCPAPKGAFNFGTTYGIAKAIP
jgi:hypothetical protein